MIYSSLDIADVTGASLRQLQWWDEAGVLKPRHMGHRREYSETQMIEAKAIMDLRNKGLSLQNIRVVFRSIQKTWQQKPVGLIALENPGALLLAMHKRGEIVTEPEMVIQLVKDSPKPVVVIELGTANGNGNSTKVPAGSKPKSKSR